MPLNFRPATAQDIRFFYPELRFTFRAWVAEDETGLLGIGGVYYDGNNTVAFSRYDEEINKYRLAKAQGLKKIMEIVGDRSCLAIADPNIPGSENLLERVGFKHIEGRVYKWMSSTR